MHCLIDMKSLNYDKLRIITKGCSSNLLNFIIVPYVKKVNGLKPARSHLREAGGIWPDQFLPAGKPSYGKLTTKTWRQNLRFETCVEDGSILIRLDVLAWAAQGHQVKPQRRKDGWEISLVVVSCVCIQNGDMF